MIGRPSPTPNYHLERIKQPNIEEAPEEARLPTGASRLGVLVWRGTNYLHAAIVLQPHGHAMGIQWTTARIPAGCDLGATVSRRNAIAKAGVELGATHAMTGEFHEARLLILTRRDVPTLRQHRYSCGLELQALCRRGGERHGSE